MKNPFPVPRICFGPSLLTICCFSLAVSRAEIVNFTTVEGYADGSLNANSNWDASDASQSTVNTSGTGTASVAAYRDAIFLPALPIATGDVFTTAIDFTFTGSTVTDYGVAKFKPFLDASFYASDASGELLKIGFARSDQTYALNLQANWRNDIVPPFTTGNAVVGGISAPSVGINRDGDLESDLLRLTLDLIRGTSDTDWSLTATLSNLASGSPIQISQLVVSGLTFPTTGTLAAGFGGGQSDNNAKVSNRLIHRFQFERESNTPPPPPVDPPPTGPAPADLNQNGIPDLAELTIPLIAQYPPAGDTDGDGQSNADELVAGTDPFDAESTFGEVALAYLTGTPDQVDFTFATVPGVRYTIEISETLAANSWTTLTPEVTASEQETTLSYDPATLPITEARCFFRAGILPSLDSDSDGLEDALELYLGFGINSAASVRAASEGGDYAQLYQLLHGANPNGGLMNETTPGIPSEEQAARFLNQATFGATPEKIDALRLLGNNAYEFWIDQQLALPANSFASPYLDLTSARRLTDYNTNDWDQFAHKVDFQSYWADYLENLQTVWMRLALFAPDELRQRVAWGLSQIFVAGPDSFSHARGQAEWYDTCIRNATGNYRTLLFEIAVNPWMGIYLSHEGNEKADPSLNQLPDENFAREIMQLFSIGLWELNNDGTRRLDFNSKPIPSYTNDDITQVARVFTGLKRNFSEFGGNSQDIFSTAPMLMKDNLHDKGDTVMVGVYGVAEKTFLQSPFYTPASLPAFENDPGRTGMDDVNDTIDILFNHPNTPPFISKRLIQHLVTSNPSPDYVERVANVFIDDGTGTRGNLAAVVKGIFLDDEARGASAMLASNSGRLKAPMLRLTNLCRIFEVGIATPSIDDLSGIQAWNPSMSALQEDFKQAPHQYPSVFNFYEPGYSRPGEISDSELVSPEFQILDSASSITLPNRIWQFFSNGHLHTPHPDAAATTPNTDFQFSVLSTFADDTDALLDKLNTLLCQGQMKALSRSQIASAVDGAYPASAANRVDRIKLATYLVTISHDGAVLK